MPGLNTLKPTSKFKVDDSLHYKIVERDVGRVRYLSVVIVDKTNHAVVLKADQEKLNDYALKEQEYLRENDTGVFLVRNLHNLCPRCNHDEKASMHEDSDLFFTSEGLQICPRFMQGRCKWKDRCRLSHALVECIYCEKSLRRYSRLNASAHLSKCWRRFKPSRKHSTASQE